MRIYSIQYDSNLKCTHEIDCAEKEHFSFANQFFRKETESYKSLWTPPSIYHLSANPVKQTFFGAYSFMSYAFYDTLLEDEALIKLLEFNGELLPIPCSDSEKTVYQYHCMNCIGRDRDMIADKDAAEYPASTRHKIAFRKNQMPDRGLFWLRTETTFLYTVENEELGIEHNFKMLYDARGYTGLDFVEAKLI